MANFIIEGVFLFLLYSNVQSREHVRYTYSDIEAWGKTPTCNTGRLQSPIDIKMAEVTFAREHSQIFNRVNHDSVPLSLFLYNTGYALKINATWSTGEIPKILVTNDLVNANGEYQFEHFYLHWCLSMNNGSEHTIDGLGYPAEGRITYKNTKYDTVNAAMHASDGLLSVNYFYRLMPESDEGVKYFSEGLKDIKNFETFVYLPSIPLTQLAPDCGDYYALYDGSLTTPPCWECVTWLMCLSNKIGISNEDLNQLRQLSFFDGGHANIRPIMEKKDHKVYYVYF